MTKAEVKEVNPTSIKEWNTFARDSQQICTIAHNPSLGIILRESFGYEPRNLCIYERNKIVGIFPSCIIRGKVVSMPHFSYGGILGAGSDALKSVWDYYVALGIRKYEIRSFHKFGKYADTSKVTCFLDLKESVEAQHKALRSPRRRQIKQSQRFGLELRMGGIELLCDFYKVYSINMRYLGSPPLPMEFFGNILKCYDYGEAKVFCVYHDCNPIGASIVLSYNKFSEVCWVSTIQEYNKYKANTFLYWEMIKYSVENKYRIFSFGRSTAESSQHKFKLQWSAEGKQLYFNHSSKKTVDIKQMKFMSRIWARLPLGLCNILGPSISARIY